MVARCSKVGTAGEKIMTKTSAKELAVEVLCFVTSLTLQYMVSKPIGQATRHVEKVLRDKIFFRPQMLS